MTVLHKGDNFKKFLVDRYAMGFSFTAISAEFENIHGIPINKEDAEKILEDAEEEIIQREEEIQKTYLDRNTLQQIMNVKDKLISALDNVEAADDFKSIASISNSLIKALEVLTKSIEAMERRQAKRGSSIKTDNYSALKYLESEGFIEIKEKEKLKKMLGVDSDG